MPPHPRRRPHRRHARARAPGDAPQAAAHSGHHARVALPAADRQQEPRHPPQRSHGHRRRNPRPGPRQARLAPGALARAARPPVRAAAGADRPVGHAAADRRDRPLPRRHAKRRRRRQREVHIVDTGHVRQLDLAVEVPPSELSAVCSHDTMGRNLRPAEPAHSRTSQHADVRQHAANGRTCRPRAGRAARRRPRGQPSRQPAARDAPAGRRAAQERPAQGDRRHRLARIGHRHRLHRPGLPDRLAALDRHVLAARRPGRAMRWAACPRGGCSR